MTPQLDPLEVIQALIPGSRVAVMRLEDNPDIFPWCAWIDYRTPLAPQSLTVGAASKPEALQALRDAVKAHLARVTPEPVKDEF